MNATVVDLRYKTRAILEALDRREKVNILYHGKLKGTLIPAEAEAVEPLAQHPFFGSLARTGQTSTALMKDIRGGRYRGL